MFSSELSVGDQLVGADHKLQMRMTEKEPRGLQNCIF